MFIKVTNFYCGIYLNKFIQTLVIIYLHHKSNVQLGPSLPKMSFYVMRTVLFGTFSKVKNEDYILNEGLLNVIKLIHFF